MAIYTSTESLSKGCGIGSWRPKWLQRWATANMFILMLAIIGTLQSSAFAYTVASVTTLEKRYAFNSFISGIILIADDISGLIFKPIYGYLANHVHRPRLIGCSTILVGIGCYLAALPYFIYGPAVHLLSKTVSANQSMGAEFCDANRTLVDECVDDDNYFSFPILPVLLPFMSMFLNGLGSAAVYYVGIPFLDDSVDKKKSPMYISLSACLRLLGPAFAFFLSSYVLNFYENPLMDPGISDKRDPRWVGAWWIGFVILGTLIFTFSLPLFLFPAEFKTGLVFSNKKDGEKSPQVVVKKRNKDQELRLDKRLLRLVKNPIYMCYVFGTTFRVFGVMGYYTFKPKFLESQYKKSASTANLFSGIVGTVPAAIGLLLGGAYLTYVQPGPLQLTSFITVVELLGTMSYVSALFLGCPQTTYAALPVNNANTYGADLMCNTNCSCPQKFQPICGPDNYTNYFSACFAGCSPQSLISMNGTKQYSDCSCIDSPGVATEGFCEPNCGNNFEILILLGAIAGIIGRPAMAGNVIISFRIVDPVDKSLAMGLAGAFYSIFAFIPYPLVYGWVTNTACEVWESKCGKTGNCLVYDSDKFRNRLHGLTLTLYYIGSVFDIIVVLLSKRIKNLYEDEEEEDQESDDNINNK